MMGKDHQRKGYVVSNHLYASRAFSLRTKPMHTAAETDESGKNTDSVDSGRGETDTERGCTHNDRMVTNTAGDKVRDGRDYL